MSISNLKGIAKKILCEPLFYLLPLIIALYIMSVISAYQEFLDIRVTRDGKTENIKLPYSFNAEKEGTFYIFFNLSIKNKNSAKFSIIPDDCIHGILINGEKFPLEGIKGLCDYASGVYFDFSEYVHEGLNNFELQIFDTGGAGGLRIEIPYSGFRSLSLLHYIFALLFLLSIALILIKFKFKFMAISIILLGIAVRFVIYTYTGPLQHSYDTGGHLEYIQVVAEEKRLPKMNEGWSAYHQPLYYIVCAVVKNIADRYDTSYTNRVLQQFNLLLSFGCIIFGVALILNLLGNNRFAYLASLISVLWPGFVLAAPRINNDCLFYFGALLCMLFAQRYWRLHKNTDILLASVGAAIALAAKSTGFVILGVWVIIYILNAVRYLKIGSLRLLLASIFIIALSAFLSNYRAIVEILEGKTVIMVGNIGGLNRAMKVNNTTGNYLYFDLKDYILEPYTSGWEDKGGRQYFWNFALKTSLFGEFRVWKAPVGYALATMLNIFVLLIFIFALWGIMHVKLIDIPPLLFAVFLLAALIYARVNNPFSCASDFRFIFPVLFPLTYFSVRGVQILQDSRMRKIYYASMLIFAGLSFLFTIGQAV
jgi:hypothetical protein